MHLHDRVAVQQGPAGGIRSAQTSDEIHLVTRRHQLEGCGPRRARVVLDCDKRCHVRVKAQGVTMTERNVSLRRRQRLPHGIVERKQLAYTELSR